MAAKKSGFKPFTKKKSPASGKKAAGKKALPAFLKKGGKK